MKYMVMECHPGYAVVLAEDGRFLKAANMRYEVGQIVTNIVEMQVPQQQVSVSGKRAGKWVYSLAAMAACLVLVIASVFQMDQRPFASVYLSINPEIRIDVNKKDQVIGLEGVNADGKDLIEDYQYKKKGLDQVMDELVARAIDMDYLHEGGQITLTLDAEDDQWIITTGQHLDAQLTQRLTESMSVTIEVGKLLEDDPEVTVPISSADSYGSSDYSQDVPDPEPSYDDTDYGPNGDGVTIYIDPGIRDDGQTDYDGPGTTDSGQSNYDGTDDGQSNYDVPDATDDGQSSYDAPDATDDGQSSYDAPDATDDGQSSYDAPDATDDGQSNYDVPDATDDGQSSYDVPDATDSGQSNYDVPADTDSGQSNYGTDAEDGRSDYDGSGDD